MVDASNEFKKAIELAEQERVGLLEKLKGYETTRMRIAQLDTFISTGKSLYNIDVSEQNESSSLQLSIPEVPEIKSGTPTIGKPIKISLNAQRAVEILSESTRALKISEIEKEFRKRNWELSEKNGKQVLRNVLLLDRKQPLFKNNMINNTLYFTLQKA